MAFNWLTNFFVPLIKTVFLVGIFGFIAFLIIKAFKNAWKKSWKFFFKYKILKKPYPPQTMEWIIDKIGRGMDYYDVKKLLLIKSHIDDGKVIKEVMSQDLIDEIAWLYIQIDIIYEKGGNSNGRKFKRCHSKNKSQSADLPTA